MNKKEYVSPTSHIIAIATPQLLYYTTGLVKVEYNNPIEDQDAVSNDGQIYADPAYPALGKDGFIDWDEE